MSDPQEDINSVEQQPTPNIDTVTDQPTVNVGPPVSDTTPLPTEKSAAPVTPPANENVPTFEQAQSDYQKQKEELPTYQEAREKARGEALDTIMSHTIFSGKEQLTEAQRMFVGGGPVGEVMKAFGQGWQEGATESDLDPDTIKAIKGVGAWDKYKTGEEVTHNAFIDSNIVPAAHDLYQSIQGALASVPLNFVRGGLEAMGAITGGAEAGVRGVGSVTGHEEIAEKAAQGIEFLSSPEAAAVIPADILALDAELATSVPPKGLSPREIEGEHGGPIPMGKVPPVVSAKAAGVIEGKDGEAIYMGLKEPSPEQWEAMKVASRVENAVRPLPPSLGEAVPVQDVHDLAAQYAPEAVGERNRLVATREVLRTERDRLRDERDATAEQTSPYAEAIKDNENRLANTTDPKQAKIFQQVLDETREKHESWIDENTKAETPAMAAATQKLQAIDFRLQDIAKEGVVPAAYRKAAEDIAQQVKAAPEPVKVPEEKFTPANVEVEAKKQDAIAEENNKEVTDRERTGKRAQFSRDKARAAEKAAADMRASKTKEDFFKAIDEASTATKEAERQEIVSHRKETLKAAGIKEHVASAEAELQAAHYRARSERFGGALGTPAEMYHRDAAEVQKHESYGAMKQSDNAKGPDVSLIKQAKEKYSRDQKAKPPAKQGTLNVGKTKVKEKAGFTPIQNYLRKKGVKFNTAGEIENIDKVPEASVFNDDMAEYGLHAKGERVDKDWLEDQLDNERRGKGAMTEEQRNADLKSQELDRIINAVEKAHAEGRTDKGIADMSAKEVHDFLTKEETERQAEGPQHAVNLEAEHEIPVFSGELGLFRAGTKEGKATLALFKGNDVHTLIHETGHEWADQLLKDAEHPDAPQQLRDDAETLKSWSGLKTRVAPARRGKEFNAWRTAQEKIARGFERYMQNGEAPTKELAGIFKQFAQWLTKIYENFAKPRGISPEVQAVFDRWLHHEVDEHIIPEHEPSRVMADIHTEDAATTPPEKADGSGDVIDKEIDLTAEQHNPEISNALTDADKTGEIAGQTTNTSEAGAATEPVAAGSSTVKESEPVGTGISGSEAEGTSARAGESANGRGNGGTAKSDPTQSIKADNYRDMAGNIRMELLTDNEKVKDFMRSEFELNRDFYTHDVVGDSEIRDLAAAMGVDDRELSLQKLKDLSSKDGIPLAVRVTVGRDMLRQSARDGVIAFKNAKDGTEKSLLALEDARLRHLMIAETVSKSTNEIGRAQRAHRDISGETLNQANALTDLFQKMGNVTPEQYKKYIEQGSMLDKPDQVAKFLQDSKGNPDFWDKVVWYRINALISGPMTHAHYMVGNAATALYEPLVKLPFQASIGALRGDADRVYFKEIPAQLYGLTKGSVDGFRAARIAWNEKTNIALPGELPRLPHGYQPVGKVGQFLNMPSRAITALHVFSKQVRYEQNIQALAVRSALKDGLEGDAFNDRVARLTSAPSKEVMAMALQDNPEKMKQMPEDLEHILNIKEATRKALRQTYIDPAVKGSGFEAVAQVVNKVPALKIMIPFMKIGTSIESQALIEGTPLAFLNQGMRDNLLGKNGGARMDEAWGTMAAGTALMGSAVTLASQGLINGDGPSDPKARATWLLTHKPNSIQIGDMTVPLRALGYLGLQMKFAANMYETAHFWNGKDGDKLASTFMESLSKSVLDDNWLYGVSQMLDAAFHHEEHGARFLRDFATSWLPFSVGLQQTAQVIDPFERETNSTFEAALRKLPGASESLLPRRDVFGMPVSGNVEQHYLNDPTVQRLESLHIGVGKLQNKIRGVSLTPEQYDDYSRIAGMRTKMLLDNYVQHTFGANIKPSAQIMDINHKITSAREFARSAMLMKYPDIKVQALAAKRRTQ